MSIERERKREKKIYDIHTRLSAHAEFEHSHDVTSQNCHLHPINGAITLIEAIAKANTV